MCSATVSLVITSAGFATVGSSVVFAGVATVGFLRSSAEWGKACLADRPRRNNNITK